MKENSTRIEPQKPGYSELFLSFLKLGVTSFGGPAMVVYIRKLAVEKKRWLDDETFRHGAAICQSIPGSISMQAAAYVGLRLRGIAGAAASFLGFGLPAFLFMIVLTILYAQLNTIPGVVSIFSGLAAIVVAITANAALSFGRTTLLNWRDVIITFMAAVMFTLGINPILAIVSSAAMGIILYIKKTVKTNTNAEQEQHYSLRPIFILIGGTLALILILFLFQPKLFNLSAIMLRVGLFAFGGAYGIVPLMYHEVVEVNAWLSAKTFLDGIVLGQITPGPIIMTSTFVGYFVSGPVGAILATFSVFLPSFVVLVVVVPYFDKLQRSPYFAKAITGVLCSFVGLILAVTLQFAGSISWDIVHILLFSAALIALIVKVDILWVVLSGAVISAFAVR
jgi:chromate transporter